MTIMTLIGIAIVACVSIIIIAIVGTRKPNYKYKPVRNTKRKFGSALFYHPVRLNGRWHLFTDDEINGSGKRADMNKEDLPK